MKKSSTHSVSFCYQLKPKSISLLIVLILFYSALTQAQSSNQFFRPSQFDPRTDFPLVYLNGQMVAQPVAPVIWENIQSVVIDQPVNSADTKIFAKPVSLNIDQVRNGSGTDPVVPPLPATWVNGNAGSSNAHYAEGWSIPYRCVIENLPNGAHSVDIEWDTRQSSSSAIDFVTNYDLLDYLPGSHVNNFGHVQEVINPIVESGSWSSGTATVIPTPDFTGAPGAVSTYYSAIMTYSNASGPANKFSVWNANITSMSYISQSSVTGASGSSRLRIFFTNTAPTVVIAWGGHIAKGPGVWGDGNSASAVSGSPYHTRLIEWDDDGAGPHIPTSVGNQDRSLSADAVLDPPICDLNGPSSFECSSTSSFTSGVSGSDLANGVTGVWSVVSATCGTSNVSLTNAGTSSVSVSVTGCSCSFVLRYALMKSGTELSHCDKTVTVSDTQAPTITCANPTSSTVNCPASATDQFVEPTATDACSTPTVTHSDATTPGSCAGNFTVTRTWTARDACGNTSTCSRSVTSQDITPPTITGTGGTTTTLGCNPSASDISAALGTATATDGCSTPTVSSNDGSVSSSSCSRSQTRTFTARDACGNTSTASRTVTWTADQTGPTITTGGTTLTLGCNPSAGDINAALGTATATDGCSTPTITPSDGSVSGTSCSRSQTRTFTAIDVCGNTSTAARTVTWTADVTPPVFTFCPSSTTIDCPATPSSSFGTPTATDACSTPTITPSDATTPGTCANNFSVTRTWTAIDACGNTSTCKQTITVRDITAPVITCPPNVVIECDVNIGTANLGSATATDACGTASVSSTDGTPVVRGCVTVITRKWVARDACGNTSSCSQTITKRDHTGPVINCANGTATDNCSPVGDITIYLSNGIWTAIDGSGNITTASAANCSSQGSGQRAITSTVTEETKEQKTVTEEKTKAKNLIKAPVIANDVKVNAIPNPFNDRVKFVVTSPQAGYGTLEVMNVLGQKIKTVYQGHISAGEQSFEMSLPVGRYSSLFYILRINGKQVTGKLIQKN